jgi:hypothetical protein
LAQLQLSPLTRLLIEQLPSVSDLAPEDLNSPLTSYFEDTQKVLPLRE